LIAGRPISDGDLERHAAGQLRELNAKIFEIKQLALDDMIDEQLLNAEASGNNLTVQKLLDREVDSRLASPSNAEVELYYGKIKDRLARPIEEVRPQIIELLTNERRRNAYATYLSQLRLRHGVVILLSPPRSNVEVDPGRVRGPENAPITIVEFSDFECPYCGRVEETLRELVSRYPTQIKLAFRDFPFHAHSEAAAEASRCASAQGKYWKYHDLLFENQVHLEDNDLASLAVGLHLDRKKFSECLTGKVFAADVLRDVDAGQKLGITGTPTFFINGIVASGAIPLEEFARLIDRELDRLKAGANTP
jgi:protein-disulfide isomerase